MAPVIRSFRESGGLSVELISSGQHTELLVPLFDWFDLRVDNDLSVMTHDQSLSELTARLVRGFEAQFSQSKPDLVLAQGDTSTVLCAALVCFYRKIPFAHVESGLRTFDLQNPFPEEFNRVAVTRLARLHFCPTERARANVLAENVSAEAVHVTGNTVIDALYYSVDRLTREPQPRFGHDILLTAHRRENFGGPLENICRAVIDICHDFPQLRVLYPVHPNPNVRPTVERLLSGLEQVTLVEPLDYPHLVSAMQSAKLILTDSGGIQEEAPALGKPVLVLREVTERPEATDLGVAKVVGTDRSTIVAETRRLLTDTDYYGSMARGASPYGDGRASDRILKVVERFLH
jgi:UDP-N-acetylglucosamine 2-epimerase (non-hydrolysing)